MNLDFLRGAFSKNQLGAPGQEERSGQTALVPGGNGIRILVVEDEYIVGFEMLLTLEEMGYRTVGPAATGQEALAMAKTERPDVALMDIILAGEMNGVETARLLMEKGVPIIFTTASSERQTYEAAMALAPLGFFRKPLDYAAIDRLIREWNATRSQQQALAAS